MPDHDTTGDPDPALPRGVHIERRGRVAVITVSDPERRNAMAVDLAAALVERIGAAEADAGVGAVVVTGTPPAFCAGADLVALDASGKSREQGLRDVYAGFVAVADCTLPTVAAVNGAAVGAGMNLALACDVRLAGPTARFNSRFLRLGIHPGGGYTWMAQRILGPQGAAAATLFSEILDAREAERVGLVWRAVADPVAAAVAMATTAAEAPRDLAVTTKRTLRATANLDARSDALEMEIRAQLASLDSRCSPNAWRPCGLGHPGAADGTAARGERIVRLRHRAGPRGWGPPACLTARRSQPSGRAWPPGSQSKPAMRARCVPQPAPTEPLG